ncbi:MAG: DJ-1/PfpI family protein [Pseudomonadota bacterium]
MGGAPTLLKCCPAACACQRCATTYAPGNCRTFATLTVAIALFPRFETLDALGRVEMFRMHRDQFEIRMVAEEREPVTSVPLPEVVASGAFSDGLSYDIILVPGAAGTRSQKDNRAMMDWLRDQAARAQYVASVRTRSALLARSGVLDGRKATSNKRAIDWVINHCLRYMRRRAERTNETNVSSYRFRSP